MPTYECICGAKYRFSDAHAGRKSKCKKCDAVFTLAAEDDPIPIADDPHLEVMIDSVTARHAGVAPTVVPPPTAPGAQVIIEKENDEPTKGPGGYGQDLFWSFLFATHPQDLVVFLILCAVLAICDGLFGFIIGTSGLMLFGGLFVGAFLFLLWLIFKGWFAGVRFAILESAASGEEHLPNFSFTSDWFEDYLVPAMQWFMSWFIVLIPPALFMIDFAANHPVGAMASVGMDLTAPLGTPTVFEQTQFWVLAGLGLFMWPMVILCITLGGVSTIARVDLLFITIAKTFPVYFLTVAIVYAAEGGGYLLRGMIYDAIAPLSATGDPPALGQRIIAAGAGDAVYIYLSIVMLRAIGLYYHHFKHRFAWNWG